MLGLLLLQVLASCLWLGHSEVGETFASCSRFFYKGYIPQNVQRSQYPVKICQRYKKISRFATLYDRDRRIPVYSAYKYDPGKGSRSDKWFVEPQLVNQNYENDMDTESHVQKKHQISERTIGQRQAITPDYYNLRGLNRGHLNPSRHQTLDYKLATFTLTNIVPQDKTLNEGAWNDYESIKMRELTQDCTATYVITGAVPGNRAISDNRVNIPSHIWSAGCCQTNTNPKSWAVIAENNNRNQVQQLSLRELETTLTQLYGRGQVSLFHSDCPR